MALTLANLGPTFVYDEGATTAAQNEAALLVHPSQGHLQYQKNRVLVPKGEIDDRYWQLLKAENEHYVRSLDKNRIKQIAGIAALVAIITTVLCVYVARFQPKVVRKHARAVAIAGLLLSMLLVAQVAGIGHGPR